MRSPRIALAALLVALLAVGCGRNATTTDDGKDRTTPTTGA
jgi:hypothetical protein